jgi:type II secretory pathway component PulF
MNAQWREQLALYRLKSDVARRADFYDVMADSAEEGLAQVDVLQKLRKHLDKSDPLGIMIDRVQRRLRGSEKSASGAQMRTIGTELKGFLPDVELSMIVGGESSGAISQGWRNAAAFARRQREMQGAIRGALAMPAFYMVAFMGLLLFMSFYLLPRFEAGRPRTQWPPMAQTVGWVADHVLLLVGGFALLFFASAALIRWLNANWVGPHRLTADNSLPIFRAMARIQGASFMMALSSFMAAGVSFGEALQRMQQTASPYMRWQIRLVEGLMRRGTRPEEALLKISLIAREYHWIISVYGMISSTDASRAYERIANEMANRTQKAIQIAVGKVLGNAMLLLLGAGVMLIYFSMYAIVGVGLDL